MTDLRIVLRIDCEPTEVIALGNGSIVPLAYADGRLTLRVGEPELFEAVKMRP